jgi:hypothetical protein
MRIAKFEIALFDDDLSDHVRVDAAEVWVLTGCGEREGEFVVGVEGSGLESVTGVDDRVRHIIVIDPSDRGPNGYGKRLRRKAEIVDLDLVGCRGLRRVGGISAGIGRGLLGWGRRIWPRTIYGRCGNTRSARRVARVSATSGKQGSCYQKGDKRGCIPHNEK